MGMATATPPGPRSARFLGSRFVVLAAAVGLGLALQSVVARRLSEITALAETDVLAARAQLAALLRVGGALLFGLTGAIGVSIAVSSRRAIAAGRFPAPGLWSWGARVVATGPAAVRMARVGLVLGAVVAVLSGVAAALVWYIAAVLLACRAL
jgi:hypothetical protein